MSRCIGRLGSWLLVVILSIGLVRAASATGIGLYWDDCGAGGGQWNKNFACNTNDANHDLYVSVDPPPGVTLTFGHNHFIDLQSDSSPLPAWWEFKNAGTCRQTSLVASGEFTTGPSGGQGCVDPWQEGGSGSVAAYNQNFNGYPNRARLIGSISVPDDLATPMTPGTEYYSIKFRINGAKTVGTDACGGCLVPVCMVLNLVRILQPPSEPAGDLEVANPLPGGVNFVLWQQAWCFTPVLNRTWGQIKTLYR